MKQLLDNGALVTLGLVAAVAAVGAANKAGLYGSTGSAARGKVTMRPLADYIPGKYRGRVIGDASYVESHNLDRREIEEIKLYLEGNGFTVRVETSDAPDTFGHRTVIRAMPVPPLKMSTPRATEAYERLLIAEAGAHRGQAMSDWQRDATASDVRKGWLPHFGPLPAWAKSRRGGSLNEGSAARGVTEGYVESYLDGDNIAISTFLGRHLRGKAKQFSGQYARRLKAALDAMVVSGEAYRATTPNGAPSYRRTSSDSGTTGSAARGFSFGWAQVKGGHVVKVSNAERKPTGTGWGEINTVNTKIGDRAYLDGGTVYLEGGSLNEGSAARGVTEGYVESYLDGDNIAISTFLNRHLRGKAKQFAGQYARRLKAALDALVVSGEAYRDTTPNGAPSYRRTSSDSGTAGSAARRTPSQIRDEAAARNNEGDVEQCWFLHGKADAVEGLPPDPAQARDQEYGADYRAGFASGHKVGSAARALRGPPHAGPSVKRMVDFLKISKGDAAAVKARMDDGVPYKAILEVVDELMDGNGVEYIESHADTMRSQDGLSYVNMGDTYDTTLLYDHKTGRFSVGSWGDIVEKQPARFR